MGIHHAHENPGTSDGADALQERLTALERMLATQQEELEQLRAALGGGEDSPELILPASVQRAERGLLARYASRRTLLKFGGAAAAAGAVAVAAGAAARPQIARAAGTDVPWQSTASPISNTVETLVQPASGYTAADLLQLRIGTGSPFSPLGTSTLKAALAAYDTTTNNIGVYGTSQNGYGLYGATQDGAGANGAAGLYGKATGTGSGVIGTSGAGPGVQGNSNTGIGGSFTGGQAPLALGLAGTAGPPSSGTHVAGEIYADSAAVLWVCTQAGAPGTWVPLAARQPTYTGGAINLLAAAMRLLDTRAGATVGNLLPGKPIPYHGTLQMPTAGVTYQGQTIPAGAKAVIGNLIVAVPSSANPGAGSSMIAYPNGGSIPASVNVVYNGPGYTGNLTLAVVGSGGLVNIYSQPIFSAAVDAIFDAFGFIM